MIPINAAHTVQVDEYSTSFSTVVSNYISSHTYLTNYVLWLQNICLFNLCYSTLELPTSFVLITILKWKYFKCEKKRLARNSNESFGNIRLFQQNIAIFRMWYKIIKDILNIMPVAESTIWKLPFGCCVLLFSHILDRESIHNLCWLQMHIAYILRHSIMAS